MLRDQTMPLERPALTELQLPPPSALLKTPPEFVPAYRVDASRGSTARHVTKTLVRPRLICSQRTPSSTLLNTPRFVAAYSVARDLESKAIAETKESPIPRSSRAHVSPLEVPRSTPPALVPRYSAAGGPGSIASAPTKWPANPCDSGFQFSPSSMLANRPRAVAA